jgi:DNA-binding transcriptional MocR family regulator
MMAAFSSDFRDGVDINVGVGYVNEKTIPEKRLLEGLREVMAHPEIYRQALNYGGPQGSQNLIDAIARFHRSHHNGKISEAQLQDKQILIGCSGATSLLDAMADVIKPGLVITADPWYYIYCNALERKGFEVVAVPEDEAGISLDQLESTLEDLGERINDIAFFYLVTVNNPTCTLLSNDRRRRMVERVQALSREQNRVIPLFLDKAYELLLHNPEGEVFESGFDMDDAMGVVYELGTLSKVLAPSLRVGYLMGKAGPFMNAIIQKTSDVGFSAPLCMQETAAWLLDHHIDEQLTRVNRGYRKKALAVRQAIDEHLGPDLEHVTGGSAGFYYYLTFKDIDTHPESAFFQFCTRTTGDPFIDGPADAPNPRVIYIPGQYCVHPRGKMVDVGQRQLRLSYGFEDVGQIENALAIMRDGIQFARQ